MSSPSQQQPNQKPSNQRRSNGAFYKYTTIAIKMAAVIVAGAFGGMKLDEITGMSFPVFTMILVLLSVGFAMWLMIRDISK